MKNINTCSGYLLIVLALVIGGNRIAAQGTAFTYQGRLNNGASPANGSYDFQFILFNVNQFGFPVGPILTNSAVAVTNGLFTTALDFGDGVFTGTNLWLDISVRTNGDLAFNELLPRQFLTPTPYSVFANSASNLLGTLPAAQLGANPVFSGTVTATNFSSSDGTFVGGTDANSIGTNAYVATIGGGGHNTILANSRGAVISGGEFNEIGSGTVGYEVDAAIVGGSENTIGNSAWGAFIGAGNFNQIDSVVPGFESDSSIVGGSDNVLGTNVEGGFIGGGDDNTIENETTGGEYDSAIVGGDFNTIGTNSYGCSIGGGSQNKILANAADATVPGGAGNVAGGQLSFAAGDRAQATNNGAFVWSDSTGTATASIINDSVTFRASGGYRFFTGTGTGGAALLAGQTSWSILSDRNAKKNFQPVDTMAVLEKLAAIPVQQWNYKWERDSDVPNIGPMAQDFKHAFYPGRDDKSINTLEFDGVELAAIQGLNQKLEQQSKDKDAEIQNLEKENSTLAARFEELATEVKLLADKK